MLKKFFLLLLIIPVIAKNDVVFSQVSTFPYNEGFETTFVTGTNIDFIPNWNGNEVQLTSRIFRDGTHMQTGTGAMAVIPISSFTGIAIVNLSFSSLINAVANFSARSVANGTGTRASIVNFSVSTDGGSTYSSPTQIGVDTTFANINSVYANYSFNFPSSTDAQSSVKLKITVSQGSTGSGTTAQFVMDDFSISGTPFTDTIPPFILSINVVNQNSIDVIFSESVEQISAETTTNYTLNGTTSPNAALLTSSNTVHLTFGTNFTNGFTNTLSVLNVKDLNNNSITTPATGQFIWFAPVTPEKYDIVITEFMPDPDAPIGLPNAEYIEIYNRSSKTFDLDGWKISDSGSPEDLTTFILTPGSYLILCSTSNVASFASFGNVLGVSSFPTLNNAKDGGNDDIVIYDNTLSVIDKIHYDETWYHDPSKTEGGWSIERIDPDFTCDNPLNWKAAVNTLGGTPGTVNSVAGDFSDEESPFLLRALVIDSLHVKVFFSEAMNATVLSSATAYSIDNSMGAPTAVSVLPDFTAATLTVVTNIKSGIIYTLNVATSISDCAGNILSGNHSVRFAIPDTAAISDIIINEILFDPLPEYDYDFVELYNRSQKIIDLSSLRIASTDPLNDSLEDVKVISSEGYLIFPGDYVVLTESPETIKNHYLTTNPAGFIKVESMPAFNDDDDAVVLTNGISTRIDQFNYSADYHFPLLNDPRGVSLERISFNRPAQDSTNWHSAAEAVGFATPAYENSQHAEAIDDGSEVSVEPEIFSPDNDGTSDVVNINYHFGEPGYIANLKIFDSKGREMIHLVKNEMLGISGTFAWDGITKENEKAKVGIYVAWLEVFNTKGTVKKFKKTIVLASKL